MLKDEFSFDYYKLDDHFDRHLEIGIKNNFKTMKEFSLMNFDEIWLRDTEVQTKWELEYHREALQIIKQELLENYSINPTIAEGAVLLPEFIKENAISHDKYICIVPTKEFQLKEYKKRIWVKDYLKNSSDADRAFANWMERDTKYAQKVKNHAEELGMNILVIDGTKTINENYNYVKKCFGL